MACTARKIRATKIIILKVQLTSKIEGSSAKSTLVTFYEMLNSPKGYE